MKLPLKSYAFTIFMSRCKRLVHSGITETTAQHRAVYSQLPVLINHNLRYIRV